MIEKFNKCPHCGGDIKIRNPKGICDHLYYPDYCNVCKRISQTVWSNKSQNDWIKSLEEEQKEGGNK